MACLIFNPLLFRRLTEWELAQIDDGVTDIECIILIQRKTIISELQKKVLTAALVRDVFTLSH